MGSSAEFEPEGVFSTVSEEVRLELEIKNFFHKDPDFQKESELYIQSPYFYFDNQKWTISVLVANAGFNFTLFGKLNQSGMFSITISTLELSGKKCDSEEYLIAYKPGNYSKVLRYTDFYATLHCLFKNAEYDIGGSLKFSLRFRNNIRMLLKTDIGNLLQDSSSQTLSTGPSLQTLSKDFKDLLADSRHSDVKIKVGDKEFKAHKSVLAARSPVLGSMFSQEMLENINGVVNISDCDADAFESLLTFLYSAQFDQIPSSNIIRLYEIAEKYDLPELKKECVKKIILELSVDSVCEALRLAALHEEKELMEAATTFFIENAEETLESPKWESFLSDHLKIGTELFKLHIKKNKRM